MGFTPLEPDQNGSEPEMSDIDRDSLKPSQVKALTALVEGHTISEAA